MVSKRLRKALKANEHYAKVSPKRVNYADIQIDVKKLDAFMAAIKKAGFSLEVDGFDEVYMAMPWTARRDGFVEYSRLTFEYKGEESRFQAWMNAHGPDFNVLHADLKSATRGTVALGEEPNPNPRKWFNRPWPATENYALNLSGAVPFLRPQPQPMRRQLEVNLPLSTDDLADFLQQLLKVFPFITLSSIAQGDEHFIDASNENESNLPSAQLTFDISSLEPRYDELLFRVVEFLHSYKVPVMRILEHSKLA